MKIARKLKKSVRNGEEYKDGTIPTCIWEVNNHTTSKDYIGWHSTTKNLQVIERMIYAYSNEGDVILDCFSGSGTTAVACQRTNRNFIGCEIDKEYHKKSIERLDNFVKE